MSKQLQTMEPSGGPFAKKPREMLVWILQMFSMYEVARLQRLVCREFRDAGQERIYERGGRTLYEEAVAISTEIGVAKYYTACAGVKVGVLTVFDCPGTPPAPPGEYQVYVALNAVNFKAAGVTYHYRFGIVFGNCTNCWLYTWTTIHRHLYRFNRTRGICKRWTSCWYKHRY